MFLDIPVAAQIGFQDPATPIAEGIVDLHHSIFFYLLLILFSVLWMFIKILLTSHFLWNNPDYNRVLGYNHIMTFRKNYLLLNNLVHGTALEIIWTITPSIILIFIAIPSFGLLYAIDEVIDPELTVKIIGHQWYWSYEFTLVDRDESLWKYDYDSYMLPVSELEIGDPRLLEVDRPLMLPINTHIRFIVTSLDVLHSFAVPSFGIKVDAVPGRLNQVSVYVQRQGVFYGQCSELCGVNHSAMPIKVVTFDAPLRV